MPTRHYKFHNITPFTFIISYFFIYVKKFPKEFLFHGFGASSVCGVYLDAPLFFQMEKVRRFGLPIFAIANQAIQTALFQREDGVVGTWIRPEDVSAYEAYVYSIEFSGTLQQQRALFRVYVDRKEWNGELGLLVYDLNFICSNRMIPPTLVEARKNCGQRCMEGNGCRLCYRTLDLANPELLSKAIEQS